ncbi:MAG: type II toxin-antitoxin system death-on-curing family toxin [Gammaproteobacteria bacterium]
MTIWLEKALVIAIHDRQLAEFGGKMGSRDPDSPSGRVKASRAKARQGGNRRESGVYTVVHEHFETISNDVSPSAAALTRAVARPQQLYAYGDPPPDLAQLAASLAFGLARNHPFVDGNKRTAYVAYRTFLVLNGAELEATDEDKYLTMLALAEGKLSEKEFAAWLGTPLRAHARGSVHEPRSTYKLKSRTRKPSRKQARRKR